MKTKKIKKQLIENFLNSFLLFLPKQSNFLKEYFLAQHKTWSLLNPYVLRISLKQILLFTKRLSRKKKKILFIIEPQYCSFFLNTIKESRHICTSDFHRGVFFLKHPRYGSWISGVILIGDFSSFSFQSLKRFNLPFFVISMYRKKELEHSYYQQMDNYTSLFFFRNLLSKSIKRYEYKKKKIKTSKFNT